jgi:exodeoxyribonuclease V alpha subunit
LIGEARPADSFDAGLVLDAPPGLEALADFNAAGVLAPADVHVARRLLDLAGETGRAGADALALAVALAVRAPRVGHVAVDLVDISSIAVGADDDVGVEDLPWPDPSTWVSDVMSSPLIAGPEFSGPPRPLVLEGSSLYLDRYWRDETSVAESIGQRIAARPDDRPVDDRLERLFPGEGSADQRAAAAVVLSQRFSVIGGGPGTGKTTTVARLLAALFEDALDSGRRPPLIALAAPTGKAAARMEEAVRTEAARIDTSEEVRARLETVAGSTLHRLLGNRFDRPGQFRHHGDHLLPHDVVIVDEASMVSLSMMARLIEAVPAESKLVLVGDPEQLVSVEAGAVLADIVGPSGPPRPATEHGAAGKSPLPAAEDAAGARQPVPSIARSITILHRNHRFSGALAQLSEAVRSGMADDVVAILASGDSAVSWIDADPAVALHPGSGPEAPALAALRDEARQWGVSVAAGARLGDVSSTIELLRHHRYLCAHRRGPAGVMAWNSAIEAWIAESDPAVGSGRWYPGRPVLVTLNDYSLGLYNGDTGVAVVRPGSGGRLTVAFDEGRGREVRSVSPTRLGAIETVFAMTVHKSQGSEFDRVTLLLPAAGSRLLTRELVYTAVTRARQAVSIVGTADALRRAVETPIARASGLGRRLWAETGD